VSELGQGVNGGEEGRSQVFYSANMIPTGTGVAEGEAAGVGKAAILLLRAPGLKLNVVLSAEDAIREGTNLVEMGRRLKSGLHIAGEHDVEPIAEARRRTEEFRGEG
jgi:hypothetical protein